MTRRVYKKLNSSGLDSLFLVLQSCNSFLLKIFFSFAWVYFLLLAWVHVKFLPLGSCGSSVLFFMGGVVFWDFLVWNLQTDFPGNSFSEGPSFLVPFVCNHVAFNLHLHLVALPVSFSMTWLAEITKKLSRSGYDFWVLVLQISNSFILNAFFNFASVKLFLATWFMISFCLQCLVVLLFCSPWEEWFFEIFWSEIFKQIFP